MRSIIPHISDLRSSYVNCLGREVLEAIRIDDIRVNLDEIPNTPIVQNNSISFAGYHSYDGKGTDFVPHAFKHGSGAPVTCCPFDIIDKAPEYVDYVPRLADIKLIGVGERNARVIAHQKIRINNLTTRLSLVELT